MLFVLIDYDESRRNAQYCAILVLQMIELMALRYKNITFYQHVPHFEPFHNQTESISKHTTTH
jgi:hypothetical protein